MGIFPIRSCSGNLYLVLAYQCDYHVILVEPFWFKHDRHRIIAYNNIRRRIKQRVQDVNLQVLDNESSI